MLSQPPERREAFVEEACKGDADLRARVEILLAGASGAASLLETPPLTPAMPTLTAGTRRGPYEIVATIGAGGMGEVYRARDTRLDRDVALEILPADLAADPARRARFEREATAIGGLKRRARRNAVIGAGESCGIPGILGAHPWEGP